MPFEITGDQRDQISFQEKTFSRTYPVGLVISFKLNKMKTEPFSRSEKKTSTLIEKRVMKSLNHGSHNFRQTRFKEQKKFSETRIK